jgi:hypothetical protein
LARWACPSATRVGDDAGQQRARADRVVVAGDDVVDDVGVAVGVDDGDDRDAEAVGLLDGDVLLDGVDDPDRGRQLVMVRMPPRLRSSLSYSRSSWRPPSWGGAPSSVLLHPLELVEAGETGLDRLEVREHPAEPAVVHVRHADAQRLLLDGLLGLALGADEQHGAALGDGVADEAVGLLEQTDRSAGCR